MLKLTATRDENIDDSTDTVRRNHHLTAGWLPSQSWSIHLWDRASEGWKLEKSGDAQLVVRGRDEDCVAVIRLGNVIEVIMARGLVNALERLGFNRADIEVA